jgi:hypothetical protein
MNEVHEQLLEVMEQIPVDSTKIQIWLKRHAQLNDELLMKSAADLCTAILKVLQEVMVIFREHALSTS